ncbi:MAG TPA: hypothetical protein VFN24_06955 [Microbacterium sp.]|nr:hypothetical protein [Microbacterium sp.]
MDAIALGWSEFAVAMAGAAAALAGLIIVAMSVNIDRILKAPSVAARAASAIAALVLSVAASCLMLIPGQPLWVLGVEVVVGVAIVLAFWVQAVRHVLADAGPGMPALPRYGVLFIAPAVHAVGAVLLLLGGAAGIAWIAAGAIVSIIVGVVVAWVALVEILR